MNPAFVRRDEKIKRPITSSRTRFAEELICPTCDSDKVESGDRMFACRCCGETWITTGLRSA